jgi:hypothetical protein
LETPERWSDTELAYLAGIIDGEGCLSMGNVHTGVYTTQIYIGNTDARVIEWLYRTFGGSIALRPSPNPKHKPLWRWLASGKNLNVLLQAVLPYLIVKKEQALLLLEYRTSVTAARRGYRSVEAPPEVVQRRKDIKARMLLLNKRGVA